MISTVTYNGDGATRVFPVAFEIRGEDYVVVFINGVGVSDRTKYDIINNSIVFREGDAPVVGVDNVEIVVASSPNEIADLNAPPSNIQTVLDNLADITAVAEWVDAGFPIVETGNAFVVETVEELSSIPAGYKVAIVSDLSRGGTFEWSATGTANGGTVFAGVSGYWNRQYSGAVNVKWFGAVGDGVTDDTAAIQYAINFMNINRVTTINREYPLEYLDGGNLSFVVSSAITILGGVELRNFVFVASNTFTNYSYVLQTDNTRHFSNCENITVDGNNNIVRGIKVQNPHGCTWNKIKVYNCKDIGIDIMNGGYEFFLNDFRIIASTDVIAHATGIRVYGSDSHYSNGVVSFYPIGKQIFGGSNIFHKIHIWSGYYANGKDSGISGGRECNICFDIQASNNIFSECNADSPSKQDYTLGYLDSVDGALNGGIGFRLSSSAFRVKLTNCSLTINTTLYSIASLIDGRGTAAQIIPFYVGGKDCSIINLVNEAKYIASETVAINNVGLFESVSVAAATTITGCDRLQMSAFSRIAGIPAMTCSVDTWVTDTVISFKEQSGTESGRIKTPNNYTTSYEAKAQLHLKLTDTTFSPSGIRYTTFATTGSERLEPLGDNKIMLGTSSTRWSVIYAGTGTINTSDAREKTFLDIEEVELQVAKELKALVKKFKFNDAIEAKGVGNARIHYGTSAQEVIEVFKKYGLDAMQYAMVCYDEWDEELEVVDSEENIIQAYRPAGNRYGIRYEELIMFILGAM